MLRKETIAAGTLEFLKELMQDEHLKDFFLVGGTIIWNQSNLLREITPGSQLSKE
jgi:hypothetical protein